MGRMARKIRRRLDRCIKTPTGHSDMRVHKGGQKYRRPFETFTLTPMNKQQRVMGGLVAGRGGTVKKKCDANKRRAGTTPKRRTPAPA